MIKVKVGESPERKYSELDSDFLDRYINQCRNAAQSICIIVQIDAPGVNMNLLTPSPTCGGPRSPASAFNDEERAISALWTERVTKNPNFSGTDIMRFLQLPKIENLAYS